MLLIPCLALASMASAETAVFWEHDDSVATIRLSAGAKGSDSFELLSDISTINEKGPTLKRVKTSDDKLQIYCVGLQDRSQDEEALEASCNVEINFFQRQSVQAQNSGRTLLIQNPEDAEMLWNLVSSQSESGQYTYKSDKGDFCIRCEKSGFSSPLCSVSMLAADNECEQKSNLKRVSERNEFLD